MKNDAADVIASGVRKAGTFSLKAIATAIRDEAWNTTNRGKAQLWQTMADSLDARHDHADPCDDCPCVQAERERWEGEGHGDDCRRNP